VFALISASVAQSNSTQPQSLGEIARSLRQQKNHTTNEVVNQPPAGAPVPDTAESLADAARRLREKRDSAQTAVTGDVERAYSIGIRQLLMKEDFAALDDAAAQARTTKSRLPGGVWTLLAFYQAVNAPLTGINSTDTQWQAHITVLKKWLEQRPESVTSRIALADAYQGYAWKARGGGYSDTVSGEGWKLLQERMESAARTLIEAYKLPAKCPYWYESMQALLRTEGIDKSKMRELFEKAIEFEPSYYHFYKEYATYLLPKWGGEPGEAEAFAEESYKRVGGQPGAFVYFEIAGTIYCDCSKEPEPLQMSWKRIQEGYAYMAANYGTSNLKLNRMALLAYQAGDRSVAHEMFAKIGDSWNPDTWRSKAHFEQVRAWAR
jgi:hypothetical protein